MASLLSFSNTVLARAKKWCWYMTDIGYMHIMIVCIHIQMCMPNADILSQLSQLHRYPTFLFTYHTSPAGKCIFHAASGPLYSVPNWVVATNLLRIDDLPKNHKELFSWSLHRPQSVYSNQSMIVCIIGIVTSTGWHINKITFLHCFFQSNASSINPSSKAF